MVASKFHPLLAHVIRNQKLLAQRLMPLDAPKHQPRMLYIGCIDARLDPIGHIGIPMGEALIYRNIAATVSPAPVMQGKESAPETGDVLATGEFPDSVSIGAALELFIEKLPGKEGEPKIITVAGHTKCGGLNACLHKTAEPNSFLEKYLRRLEPARHAALARPEPSPEEALERESVKQSIDNLMTYNVVRKAVEDGRVVILGWVLDTRTALVKQYDPETNKLYPLHEQNMGMAL